MKNFWRIIYLSLVLLCLTNCDAPNDKPDNKIVATPTKATRIVSLDFCADQYVLQLADEKNILALSSDATKEFSYLRDKAIGFKRIKPLAENALLLKPDLIVRSYGGGPKAAQFYEHAGVPVLNVGWANEIEDINQIIADLAIGLGEEDRGKALISEMENRLAALDAISYPNPLPKLLYVTPTGYTSGSGSLVHEIIEKAGFENYQSKPGWHPLPLERLATEQADFIAASFFDLKATHPAAWSAIRHPVARDLLKSRPSKSLDGSWTACGAWFILDAVEALAGLHKNEHARD